MRATWQWAARWRAMTSRNMRKGGRHMIVMGGGLATIAAVGLTVAYKNHPFSYYLSPKENGKINSDMIPPQNSLSKMVENVLSMLEGPIVKAEMVDKKPAQNVSAHHATSLSQNATHPPPAQWDHNWDKRDPKSLVKPLKLHASEAEIEAHNEKLKEATPTAKRVYVLVRHGQYEMEPTDEERKLTPLGREQANLTGKRLAALRDHFVSLRNAGGMCEICN